MAARQVKFPYLFQAFVIIVGAGATLILLWWAFLDDAFGIDRGGAAWAGTFSILLLVIALVLIFPRRRRRL